MAIVGVIACTMLEKNLLALIGAALAFIGGTVLFYDLRGQSQFTKAVEAEIHVAGLQKQGEEWKAMPKTGGVKTPEGIDIDEAIEIATLATEEATKTSEQTRLELLENILQRQEKLKGIERLAIELVVLGGAISVYANVLSA